jgi:hypothetical protein
MPGPFASRFAATAAAGLLVVISGSIASAQQQDKPATVSFTKVQLDPKFRSEGVAAADFNNDGLLDIAAGFVWYEAPEWKMHAIIETAPEYDPKGYSNSFCTFADDLNADGWTDILVIDFPGTPTWWFENPKAAGGQWKRNVLTPVTNNESPQYLDFLGGGAKELLLAFNPDAKDNDGPQRRMGYATPGATPDAPWVLHAVSVAGAPGTMKYSHGLGAGDINGDGKNDILCGEGWWEAPASAEGELPPEGEWKFHPAAFGGQAAHMYAQDFDGDGDNDVLTSSPHAYGIWWHEQVAPDEWKTHQIDDSFSQTHSVCVADINSDGLVDFVTGKRWWAHAAGDPGVDEPAVMCWFELKRTDGRPEWIKHQFDHDSGVGTQFEVVDMNRDGLLDVITSNKKGTHYFEQVRQ